MRELSFLNQLRELVGGQLAIPKNLVKQPWADPLARVHRYNRALAILVAQEIMAAFDAENRKARLSEGGNEIGTGDSGSYRDGHALNSHELQIMFRRAFDFQA